MLRHFLASLIFSFGTLAIATLGFLFWLRADQLRYEWSIGGPFPFNQIGGGPAMAAFTVISGTFALLCFGIAWRIHRGKRMYFSASAQ